MSHNYNEGKGVGETLHSAGKDQGAGSVAAHQAAEPPVVVEHRDGVATIYLNRPNRRNAVTTEMCMALHAALGAVATSDARVVILRGAGDHFSVGADLGGGAGSDGPAIHAMPPYSEMAPIYHAATLLHEMPQVTIAAIDGGCAGAALGWACACDLRLASERARFATGFINVGVAGDMGLAWSLTRIVGAARARELMFLSEKLSAQTALGYGLVNRVLPADKLQPAVADMAAGLCAKAPLALATMKANLVSAETLDLRAYIEIESARHLNVLASTPFGRPAGNAPQSRQEPIA